jgi:hypothetical protein
MLKKEKEIENGGVVRDTTFKDGYRKLFQF